MLLYSTRKMNTRKIYHGLLSKILYCFTVFFGRRRTKIKPSSDWSEPMLLQFHSFYIFLPCVICGKCMWRDKYQVVTHCDKRQRTECPRPFLKAPFRFLRLTQSLFQGLLALFAQTRHRIFFKWALFVHYGPLHTKFLTSHRHPLKEEKNGQHQISPCHNNAF